MIDLSKQNIIVTNGSIQHTGPDVGDVYRYHLLAEHDGHYFVQATNSVYKGEMYIFRKEFLWNVRDN